MTTRNVSVVTLATHDNLELIKATDPDLMRCPSTLD